MSAASIAVEPEDEVSEPPPELGQAFRGLVDEALRYATVQLSLHAGEWFGDLERAIVSRGPFERAAYEATKAHLQGKNPVWAGAKGAWAGASVPQRVVAVVVLVLVALLSPVTLIVLILGLLIAALVAGIRAARA